MNGEEFLWKHFLWPIFTPRMVEYFNKLKTEEDMEKNVEILNDFMKELYTDEEARKQFEELTDTTIIPGIPSYEWGIRVFGIIFILLSLWFILLLISFIPKLKNFNDFMTSGLSIFLAIVLSLGFIYLGISNIKLLNNY